jgi:hypothetical protein
MGYILPVKTETYTKFMVFSLISRRFFPRKVTGGSIDKEIVVPLMLFYGKTLLYIFSNKFEGPVVLVLNID